MKRFIKRIDVRILTTWAGALVLGAAVSHCSPLAESISKTQLGHSVGSGLDHSMQPTLSTQFEITSDVKSVFEVDPVPVDDLERKVTELDETLVQEFRATGRLRIDIADAAQYESAKLVFKVNLTKREVRSRNLHKLKIEVRPLHGTEVLITIPSIVSPTIVESVQNELEAMELVMIRPAQPQPHEDSR